MADVTGATKPTNASAFDVPGDIADVYDHFGDSAKFTVANVAALPATGNWVGRRLFVQSDKTLRVCTALPTTWEVLARAAVVTSYTPTWTAAGGGTPAVGTGGTLQGRYLLSPDGGVCDFWIYVAIGSSGASGGTGAWRFALPFTPGTVPNKTPVSGHVHSAGVFRLPATGLVTNGIGYVSDIVDGEALALTSTYTLAAGSEIVLHGRFFI